MVAFVVVSLLTSSGEVTAKRREYDELLGAVSKKNRSRVPWTRVDFSPYGASTVDRDDKEGTSVLRVPASLFLPFVRGG